MSKLQKKPFYCLTDVKTIALSSLFTLSVLYNTIPWSLEMSKKENIAAKRMVQGKAFNIFWFQISSPENLVRKLYIFLTVASWYDVAIVANITYKK